MPKAETTKTKKTATENKEKRVKKKTSDTQNNPKKKKIVKKKAKKKESSDEFEEDFEPNEPIKPQPKPVKSERIQEEKKQEQQQPKSIESPILPKPQKQETELKKPEVKERVLQIETKPPKKTFVLDRKNSSHLLILFSFLVESPTTFLFSNNLNENIEYDETNEQKEHNIKESRMNTFQSAIEISSKLKAFVSRVEPIFDCLLSTFDSKQKLTKETSPILSQQSKLFKQPTMLKDFEANVKDFAISSSKPNFIAVCCTNSRKKGLIFDTLTSTKPIITLSSQDVDSSSTSIIFSPISHRIVCIGNSDGDITVYDCRESSDSTELLPSFSSSPIRRKGVFSHNSSVKAMQVNPIGRHSHEEFKLFTLDSDCNVIVWIVSRSSELVNETSQCLSARSHIGVLQASVLRFSDFFSPSNSPFSMCPQSTSLSISSIDDNQVFVSTSNAVIRYIRLGERLSPSVYTNTTMNDFPITSTCVAVMPLDNNANEEAELYFAVGYANGTVSLFYEPLSVPLMSWSISSEPILSIAWSPIRYGTFFALDEKSKVYIFDLTVHQNSFLEASTFVEQSSILRIGSNGTLVLAGNQIGVFETSRKLETKDQNEASLKSFFSFP